MAENGKIIKILCMWSRFLLFPGLKPVIMLTQAKECAEELEKSGAKEIAILYRTRANKISPQIKWIGTMCEVEKKEYDSDKLKLTIKPLKRIVSVRDLNQGIQNVAFFYEDFELLEDDYSGCAKEGVLPMMISVIDLINEMVEDPDARIAMVVNTLIGDVLNGNLSLDINEKAEVESMLSDPENSSLFNSAVKNFVKNPEALSIWIDDILANLVMLDVPSFNKPRKYILEEKSVIKRMEILVYDIFPDLFALINKANMMKKNMPSCPQTKNGPDQDEITEMAKRISESRMTGEVRKVAEEELNRLKYTEPNNSERSYIKTYLNRLLSFPWGIYTEDNLGIDNLQGVLDCDHFGLQQVKGRILEHMAVQQLNPEKLGTILCLVGPPGTGKTSIAHSIGRALGRKVVRISLGSVRDEAEIKGHRRTYIGAMPGRIAEGMIRAGSQNPLFVLDEIDKLCRDYRGDPASALLEALDPEQNFAFSDHYFGVGLDLSKVMFITTANVLETIPPALLDRMEVIEFSTYTSEEKKEIAKRYLIPKQTKETGIGKYDISFSDRAIMQIIKRYIREAGVRKLERRIGKICRKIAKNVVSSQFDLRKDGVVDSKDLIKYLGKPRYKSTELIDMEPGNAVGLAWTSLGGEILHIEAEKTMDRGEKYIITGLVGEVMFESIVVIITFLQKNRKILNIDEESFIEGAGIHIHIPAGAIPKDGPSAGLSMCAAICSLLVGKPLKKDVAFTGEITLKGRVLPVGGLKEKVLAAKEAGVKKIFLPVDNKVDIDEFDKDVRKGMVFVFVSHMSEILIDRADDIFEDARTIGDQKD